MHPSLDLRLFNGATLVEGRVGNGVRLNGLRQYVSLGDHPDSCMGNLSACPHGISIGFDILPKLLMDSQHFLSTGPYALFYLDDRLHAEFSTPTKTWRTSTDGLKTNSWQRVEVSWQEDRGLQLLINGEKVSETLEYVAHAPRESGGSEVFLGKAGGRREGVYANAVFDEIQFWFAHLDVLKAFEIVSPGK